MNQEIIVSTYIIFFSVMYASGRNKTNHRDNSPPYRKVLLEAKVGSVMLRISFRYYTKYQHKALALYLLH